MIEITAFREIDIAIKHVDREATKALNQGQRYYVSSGTDKPSKAMTSKQRGALHVWCGLFATALNDAGILRKKVMFSTGEIVELDWNMLMFKEEIYKPMLDALTGKGSTEKQNTIDPSTVADHINRHIGQTKGVTVGWPSRRG